MINDAEILSQVVRAKLSIVNTGQRVNLQDWRNLKFGQAWSNASTELTRQIHALVGQHSLLGLRGTCTAVNTFTANGLTVLSPTDVVLRGHERVDRDVFQVTRVDTNKPEVDRRSSSHCFHSAVEMIDMTGNREIYPTFVLYDPTRIITLARTSPVEIPREKMLTEISPDYIRADMMVKGNPVDAIVRVVQFQYVYCI